MTKNEINVLILKAYMGKEKLYRREVKCNGWNGLATYLNGGLDTLADLYAKINDIPISQVTESMLGEQFKIIGEKHGKDKNK